jgi:hypothetical protein
MARVTSAAMHRILPLLWLLGCEPTDEPTPMGDTADEPPDVPPDCLTDADCDDGDPCTGAETCTDDGCAAGTAVTCDDGFACFDVEDEAVCEPFCAPPRPQMLDQVAVGETLTFSEPVTLTVDGAAYEGETLPVDEVGTVVLELASTTCDLVVTHTFEAVERYPDAADTDTSLAIAADDPRIVGWASSVHDAALGEGSEGVWRDVDQALGAAEGQSTTIVSLGRGGSVTLAFDPPIADGAGHDFVVFENGFSDTFLELAYVEVSSDGTTFARFDSAAHTPEPIGAFGELDPRQLHGLAGTYRQGFGTPFDLDLLRLHGEVWMGSVDLDTIRFVRIVDVVGDGSDLDSFGRAIHDPFPTAQSAGFDLDGVGVLHEAP